MPAILFAIVALAWGLTWYGIHLQLGATPDIVSIFWRFALASVLMWLGLIVTGQASAARARQHRWFAVLGLTLFSGNFLCLYGAEHDVPSGLVSVVFSMASVFNAFNQWAFRGIRPSRRVLAGAAIGILGVAFLFGERITASGGPLFLRGVLLALAGTYLFSLGNLVSGRATAGGATLPNAVARGMSWGAVFLGAVILVRGQSFVPHLSAAYLGGLTYLAVIGSMVGFLAYLSLAARVGPARAGYVTAVSPLVALAVSAVLEGYALTYLALAGVALVLMGNVVIFAPMGRAGWRA
jgi:drug/metabolite transporter (DMT)-like permease